MNTAQHTDARPSSTPIGRALGFERSLVLVIGLILVLLAAAALVTGSGWIGAFRSRRPVLDPLVLRWAQQHPQVMTPVAVVLGIALFALGLWWLVHSLRTEPRPNYRLETGLLLNGSALTSAVRADAETVTGVNRAKVRTAGTTHHPNLRLTLSLQEGTDVRHVWEELEDKVLSRARQALGCETMPTAIRLRLDHAPRQRVH